MYYIPLNFLQIEAILTSTFEDPHLTVSFSPAALYPLVVFSNFVVNVRSLTLSCR